MSCFSSLSSLLRELAFLPNALSPVVQLNICPALTKHGILSWSWVCEMSQKVPVSTCPLKKETHVR